MSIVVQRVPIVRDLSSAIIALGGTEQSSVNANSSFWFARSENWWPRYGTIIVTLGGRRRLALPDVDCLAIAREIKEELGVTVHLEDLEFICVAVRNTPAGETVAYEFAIRDKDYTFRNAEPEKCSEIIWVDIDTLPEDIIDHFKQVIVQGVIGKKIYLELGY